MLDGVKVSNALIIDMEKSHVIDNPLVDWLGSESYMPTKVVIQFRTRSGGESKCMDDRRISKLESNRGHSGGRGRGRGQGFGGCGSHHTGYNSHDPDNVWFCVVNCCEFRRRFSGEEFYKARSDGHLYVFNKRKIDKDTRHIHKVHRGGKDDGKELDITYP